MAPGPPRTSDETLRRRGTTGARGRLHAVPGPTTRAPRASRARAPKPPRPLGEAGEALWKRIWSTKRDWLSVAGDGEQVLLLCDLADEIARLTEQREPLMQAGSLVGIEKRYLDALRDLRRQYADLLLQLGLSPAGRARLNLAETKDEDPLAQFRADLSAVEAP